MPFIISFNTELKGGPVAGKGNIPSRQMAMQLLLPEEKLYALDRFYPGVENLAALAAARAFTAKSPTAFVIVGQRQSGKTHLLKGMLLGWKKGAFIDAAQLAGFTGRETTRLFKEAAAFPLVCIDNLDAAPAPENLHEEVFNLFNALVSAGGHIAAAMKSSPAKADMPDYLSSRLLTGMVVTLKRPGDEDRAIILRKIAQDRSISLTPRALAYILERSGRSVGDLLALAGRLEKSLMPGSKRIGLQLLKRVLNSEAS